MCKRVPKNRQQLRSIWRDIKRRCYNERDTMFKDYGGKKITVCKEWQENPDSFIDYALSLGYEVGNRLIRINKTGNYEPGNIKFVKPSEQAKSRRNVYLLKVTFADGTVQEESARRWSTIVGVGKERFMQSSKTSTKNLWDALEYRGFEVHSVEPTGNRWKTARDTIVKYEYNRRPMFPKMNLSNENLLTELLE